MEKKKSKLYLVGISIFALLLILNSGYSEEIEITPEIKLEVGLNITEINISYENQSIMIDCKIAQITEFEPIIKYNLSDEVCINYTSLFPTEVNCSNIPDNLSLLLNENFDNLNSSLITQIEDLTECTKARDICQANEGAWTVKEEAYKNQINSFKDSEKYSWGALIFSMLLFSFIIIIPLVRGQKGLSSGFVNKPPETDLDLTYKKPEEKK